MDIEKYAFQGIVKNAKMKIVFADKGNVAILIMNAMMAFVSHIFADIVPVKCFALKECAFQRNQKSLHVKFVMDAKNQTKFA